jgi:hypothetical protein
MEHESMGRAKYVYPLEVDFKKGIVNPAPASRIGSAGSSSKLKPEKEV